MARIVRQLGTLGPRLQPRLEVWQGKSRYIGLQVAGKAVNGKGQVPAQHQDGSVQ
jgi:hypothetical protein